MFDLRETRKTFNWPVKGTNLGEPFEFIGEYRVKDFDEFVRFKKEFTEYAKNQENADNAYRIYAGKVFVGWVNLPGRPETWIADDGEPVECTTELYEMLLRRPGVAQSILFSYWKANWSNELPAIAQGQDDGLGNSPASPDAGSTETSEPGSAP
jgi:hypothetical protein